MKSPSEYTTTPLAGLQIMVVDAGTKIKDERTGEEVEITDETTACKGRLVWCTQNIYDSLKERIN